MGQCSFMSILERQILEQRLLKDWRKSRPNIQAKMSCPPSNMETMRKTHISWSGLSTFPFSIHEKTTTDATLRGSSVVTPPLLSSALRQDIINSMAVDAQFSFVLNLPPFLDTDQQILGELLAFGSNDRFDVLVITIHDLIHS